MSVAALPPRHQQWQLFDAGLDNLELREVPVPQPAPGELLVRIDACGICFSDIKILNLGPQHPRLQGRDLRREPVVMGHETAMTVVEVGDGLTERFQPGQRFLIQADVYYQGEGMAFGYRLPGGYSQYQIIGPQILDGDEGCYLLPISEARSHAEAALCEPWACVEAAYSYRPRREPRQGGRALLVVLETARALDLAEEIGKLRSAQVVALTPAGEPWLHDPERVESELTGLAAAHPQGFDDILVYGLPYPALASGLQRMLRPGGVLAIEGDGPAAASCHVDIGSVHYRDHWFTGAPHGDPYEWDRTPELRPGGVAWFIGAGGPLGQMHLQRALSLPRPPGKIIVSQRGEARVEDLNRRFGALAAARGVQWVVLDAGALGDDVYEAVRQESGGQGCDDICVVIPNAQVVEAAWNLLAPGGGLDIFAGVPVGTEASLDLSRIATRGVRLWGTSGSSIADLRRILEWLESGKLATDRVVAAVGGIEAVKEGLVAVKEARFLGKTIIYPHLRNLPLLSLEELAQRHPSVVPHLADGRYWTPAAEAELIRLLG